MTNAIGRRVSATDPGRARLTLASAIATGMLMSALGAWAVVDLLHADAALLTVGIFLAMQMGLTPHDPTARGRCATTALLFIPAAAAATLATLLAQWRPVEIGVVIAVAGISTWVRRYGPRATALGFAAFFGYFFPLLLQLTPAELPSFLLVTAIAVGSLTLMRALLLFAHPRRRIEVLLRELRAASASVIAAAARPDARTPRTLRARLARVDGVAHAINAWQQEFDTSRHIDSDDTAFAALVLDARIDTEQACAELVGKPGAATSPAADAPVADPIVGAAVRDLEVVLDNHARHAAVDAAAARAQALLVSLGPSSAHRAVLGRLTRSTLAHKALRDVLLTRATSTPARPAAAASVPAPPAGATRPVRHDPAVRWWDWRRWQPQTRLSIQVMVAVALASIAGEMISASRWYWAILTAFIVFVGATTRGAILTRAYNRIAGTVTGLAAGIGLVLLVHDQKPLLVAICVVAAFGMMYFGPLRYLYSAFFISMMLVSMYGLLGDLDTQILELRIDETLVGAVIGVLCAYLIFSTNSHPALLAKLDAYFAALDAVFDTARDALTAPARDAPVLAAIPPVESALVDVDTFTTSMSAALLGPKSPQRAPIVHLLYVGARASEAFAQSAVAVTTASPPEPFTGDAAAALDEALAHVRTAAQTARTSFAAPVDDAASDDTVVLDLLPRVPFDALSPQTTAMVDLSRVSWVMAHIAQENARG